jgi:hypothetical protein
LSEIIKQYENSQSYEKYLQRIINRLDNKKSDASEDSDVASGTTKLIDVSELQKLDDDT